MMKNFIKQAVETTIENVEYLMNVKGYHQKKAFKVEFQKSPFGHKVWNVIKNQYDTGL